ncbi:MAG TPA: hypothetical protein VEH50_06120, partial [Methylomirabilota bacterium]|nr:hypothetical protein [Methylomirabilota bacterium]
RIPEDARGKNEVRAWQREYRISPECRASEFPAVAHSSLTGEFQAVKMTFPVENQLQLEDGRKRRTKWANSFLRLSRN